jgi:hypothetical protein
MSVGLINKKTSKIDHSILILCLVQVAYFACRIIFYTNYIQSINLCIQIISTIIVATYISNFIGFKKFAKSYIYIILVMGIGGTITFFLHYFIGIKPIFTAQYAYGQATTYFLGLTSTNVYLNYAGTNLRFIRYSGFFDEPGQYALCAIFAILMNKIYFNNKCIEILLMIVASFTFSMTFYIVAFIYFILFYFKIDFKLFLLVLCICISGVIFFINLDTSDTDAMNIIKANTISRFERGKDGSLKGDSRAEIKEIDKEIFLKYPVFGSEGTAEVRNGANIYYIPACYGIIGSLFYYALLIYLFILIMCQNKEQRILYLKVFFLIIINFYHRPEMLAVFTSLVFISLIVFIKENKTNRETIK